MLILIIEEYWRISFQFSQLKGKRLDIVTCEFVTENFLQTTKASHVGTSLDSKLIIVKQNTRWQQSTIYIGTKLEMIYILESLVI